KLTSDKLFVAANSYSGGAGVKMSVVRYGNVMGSRGSVIPFFLSIKDQGVLPITDERMTRFMITLEQGVEMVWHAFEDMAGGEIYVKKIPSMSVVNLARAIAPECKLKIVGIRPGEKVHEQLISEEDANYTFEFPHYYKILPSIYAWASSSKQIKNGKKVDDGFTYCSDNNPQWMSANDLRAWLKDKFPHIEG
ncbi:MAG: polysaccharide biosynthesis protein, partial [Paracoccaceae bacterium]